MGRKLCCVMAVAASVMSAAPSLAFSPIAALPVFRLDNSPDRKIRRSTTVSRKRARVSESVVLESSETSSPILEIGGLLPTSEYKRRSALHETLSELRQQIPCLLSVPLSEASAKKVYTDSTRLTVGPENSKVVLASDRAELISLCNIFVLALAASLQARTFVSSLVQRQQQSSDSKDELSVACQIALAVPDCDDPLMQDFTTIEVCWEVLIPLQQPMAASTTKIRGVSRLTLDPNSSRIALHQLLSVYINDSYLDANAVGQSLASLRQTVKELQNSPLFQPFLSATASSPAAISALEVFQQARNDFIRQQATQTITDPIVAPLFVMFIPATSNSTTLASNRSLWIPIDNYNSSQGGLTHIPLPGTIAWPVYSSSHKLAEYFVGTIVPILSGHAIEVLDDALFLPDACLFATDGSILLRSGTLLAGYYKSFAALRRGTRTHWTLKSVRILKWGAKQVDDTSKLVVELEVEFSTQVGVPGSSAVTISGKDKYTVSSLMFSDLENMRTCIEEVHQKQLSIGDNMKSSETLLFMKSVASAVESSSGLLPFSDGFWFDLLRRLSLNEPKSSTQRLPNQLPSRSDKAALTVYRIMEALHKDCHFCSSISDLDITSSSLVLPPGNAFMQENLQLIGYLGEPLLRGRANYNQAYLLAVRSFHTAMKSRRLIAVKEPTMQVELNTFGNIFWSLSLYLRVSTPLVPSLPGLDGASSLIINSNTLSSFNIVVKSEYVLSSEGGQILQHRILESRVNGQLTPGDVVSRWMQRRSAETTFNPNFIDWLRSSME